MTEQLPPDWTHQEEKRAWELAEDDQIWMISQPEPGQTVVAHATDGRLALQTALVPGMDLYQDGVKQLKLMMARALVVEAR